MILVIFLIIIGLVFLIFKNYDSLKLKGKLGEKIVAKDLEKVNGYKHIINDIMINDNGKSRQIDHIAITEKGVFVIETKNYAGTIYGKETSNEWKQYLNRKCFCFKNPIHQNYAHLEIVKSIIEELTDKIYSIIVFTDRAKLKTKTFNTVLYDYKLVDYINGMENLLNNDIIDKIYNELLQNKITDKDTIRNHEYNVQHYLEYKNNLASEGICPRCNGKLIKKHSKRGYFYGCSNYPKCKYTANIEKDINKKEENKI